jgi:phage terminase large subunit-like protein
MCNFTGGEQEKSPDRMDALVWGLTALSAKRVDRIGSLEMALSY